jgi:hypothetical protein
MTDRGRHSRGSGSQFYRDVLFLVAGILLVGALVFGGLSLLAGRNAGVNDTVLTIPDADATTTTPPSDTDTIRPPATTTSTTAPTTTTDTVATTTPPTTIREARPPGEVRALVLNSTGEVGIAANLTSELAALGYQTQEPANYSPELSDTMIFHADGFAIEALDLAEAVPDGTVAPNPELASEWGVDVVVVLGLSHQE